MSRARGLTFQVVGEAVIVMAAYYTYTVAKNLVHPFPALEAFRNAWDVVSLERSLGIFHEQSLQGWLLKEARGVVYFFNWVYTLGFWPLMGATSLLLFITARDIYYKYRTVLLVSFVIAVAIFALYPLAPPRFMGELGFVDTIQIMGPVQHIARSVLLSYNKFAAMPSMHFAWAMLISMAWASTPYRWARIAAVIYQSLMAVAVVVTGNHYFVDVIVAVFLVMASFYVYHLVLVLAGHGSRVERVGG